MIERVHARVLIVVLCSALAFGACGDTTSGTGHSSTSAAEYCSAEAAWRDRCKNETCEATFDCAPGVQCTPPPPKTCDVSYLTCDTVSPGCLAKVFRPEALAQMKECEAQLPCSGPRRKCSDDIALSDPLPAAADFAAACAKRQEECQPEISGENNFFCFDLSAMTDDYVALFRDCLNGPCNSIRGCHDGGKFDSYCAM